MRRQQRRLRLINEPYHERVLTAFVVASRVIGSTGKLLDRQGIALLAEEISWTPTRLLTWSQSRSLSIANQLKGLLEDTMGETWNWWPLEPRLRQLDDGFCRLFWQTVRYFIFSPNIENKVLTSAKALPNISACRCAEEFQKGDPGCYKFCSSVHDHDCDRIVRRTLTPNKRRLQHENHNRSVVFQILIAATEITFFFDWIANPIPTGWRSRAAQFFSGPPVHSSG
jgi:hypothetical protein